MAEYPIPPWLTQHADPAAEYNQNMRQAASLSAQMAMEQQRLSQQASMAAMQAQARQQQTQRENDLKQQQIQIQQARTQAEAGIQRDRLETAQQQLAQKAQSAAQEYAAQQRLQQAMAAAQTPAEQQRAILQYGAGVRGAGGAMSAAMRASNQPAPFVPGNVQGYSVTDPSTGAALPNALAYPSPTGKGMQVHWTKPESENISPSERAQTLRELDEERKEILADPLYLRHKKANDQEYQTAQARLAEIKASEEDLLPKLKASRTKTGTSGPDRVRVRSPKGKTGTVPKSRLDEYLKAGYTELTDANAR